MLQRVQDKSKLATCWQCQISCRDTSRYLNNGACHTKCRGKKFKSVIIIDQPQDFTAAYLEIRWMNQADGPNH